MTNLLYVVIPVVLVLLAFGAMAARGRRPRSLEAGVEEFSRELRALAPEYRSQGTGRRFHRGGRAG